MLAPSRGMSQSPGALLLLALDPIGLLVGLVAHNPAWLRRCLLSQRPRYHVAPSFRRHLITEIGLSWSRQHRTRRQMRSHEAGGCPDRTEGRTEHTAAG